MKRVQLFEFEDFSWFPTHIRNSMTNLIVVLHKMMGIPPVLGKLIQETLKETRENHIIDLGSGSGGPMPLVHETLRSNGTPVTITLTDKHPNPQAITEYSKVDGLNYLSTPVDATNISEAPKGLKTMVNSFHHMPLPQAKSILRSAQESKQPILIYEIAENNIPLIIWWLLLPISLTITALMCLVMTPFSRPMTWQQLIFTYVIPIIPICYAWDGQASLPRMYTFNDIDEILSEFPDESYVWKKGRATDAKGKKRGTYLIGMPK